MQNKELFDQFKTLAKNTIEDKNFLVIPILDTNHKLGISKEGYPPPLILHLTFYRLSIIFHALLLMRMIRKSQIITLLLLFVQQTKCYRKFSLI